MTLPKEGNKYIDERDPSDLIFCFFFMKAQIQESNRKKKENKDGR